MNSNVYDAIFGATFLATHELEEIVDKHEPYKWCKTDVERLRDIVIEFANVTIRDAIEVLCERWWDDKYSIAQFLTKVELEELEPVLSPLGWEDEDFDIFQHKLGCLIYCCTRQTLDEIFSLGLAKMRQ